MPAASPFLVLMKIAEIVSASLNFDRDNVSVRVHVSFNEGVLCQLWSTSLCQAYFSKVIICGGRGGHRRCSGTQAAVRRRGPG